MSEKAQFDWERAFAARAGRMGASEIRELLKLLDRPDVISFAGGIPDPTLFPGAAIGHAYSEILGDNREGRRALQYSISEGYLPLRQWLVDHMASLGVACDADNIVITSGSQQGLDFLGKLFLSPGDTALVTSPTYLGALQAFNAYEPRYDILLPGDTAGLRAAYAGSPPAAGGRAALVYVVPDFANPTGQTISEAARQDLLELADGLGVPLIEDAAYSALRLEGRDIPSCLALDLRRGRSIDESQVIYCGTFSKTIAPGLRVGWVCAARSLVRKLVLAKQAGDLHSSTVNQMAMERVARVEYRAQIQKICQAYRPRRDSMLEALGAFMPAGVRWTEPEGGMFVWVTLPEGCDTAGMLAAALQEEHIAFVPGSAFHVDGQGQNTLRLAFSLQPEPLIIEGMRRLGSRIAHTIAPV